MIGVLSITGWPPSRRSAEESPKGECRFRASKFSG